MNQTLQQLVGRTIKGAYKLDSLLGMGGMGAVFRGTQLAVDREVAIKVLRPMAEASQDMLEQMQARFRREAALTAKLKHPNTVQLIDFGATEEGMLFLVLEFLEGEELSRAMQSLGGPMPPARVAHIGQQICLSLSEAHDKGLIHRDLKPDNIFLANYHGASDHVKVMDFGIARVVNDDEQTSALTATGLIIGTPKYMSPEQVETKPLTAQTDLYALGVILYELLMGKAPFHAESVMSLAFKHVHEAPPPIDESFGDDWLLLIEALLAKDPTRRPASAAVVATRLQELAVSSGGMAAARTPAMPLPTAAETMGDTHGQRAQKKPIGLMVALAVLVVGVAGGLFALAAGGDEKPSPSVDEVAKSKPVETPKVVDKKQPATEPEPAKPAPASKPEPKPTKKAEAKPAPTKPKPPPPPTQLKLRTTPAGAEVFQGSNALCTTPCDLPIPGDGEAVLVIRADGHHERQVTVPLRLGSVVDRELMLQKIPEPTKPKVEPVATKKPKPGQRKKKLKNKTKKPGGLEAER